MITIGIDARPLSYQLTGIGFYLKSLLDELQTVDQTHHYVLISNTGIDYDIKNPNWSKQEGGCAKKLMSTVWMQSFLPVLARRLELDVFWGPRHHLPVFLPPDIKKIVTIHDVVHLLFPETMSLPNLLIERMLMRLSLASADRIVAVSNATREAVLQRYPVKAARVRMVHSGVPQMPPATPEAGLPIFLRPEKYFLFVGTLEPRKNFERIFKAFEGIDAPGRGIHLVITGASGWKNQTFIRMLEAHPLRPFVHFTGYVSRRELGLLYENALGLVFPSLYEGFGFPILEAMISGTPVITSNTSAMREVAGDAALLVDPRDIVQIARAMEQLISDAGLRNALIQRGGRRTKAFSWHRAALEMIRMFQEVTGN